MEKTVEYTLVSGASSGIGRAIAVSLAKTRRLILHGRNLTRLEESRQACANQEEHLLWPQDFREIAKVESELTRFLNSNACVVVAFVHCAGAVHVLPARSASLGAVQESLNVNYIAAQQIVATLLRKRVNHAALKNVVFISSIWSSYGARGHSVYCASKAALDGLMRALAVELAPEVKVNSILPGAVRTPMSEPGLSDHEICSRLEKDYPLGVGSPSDIAETVLFLLSNGSRWITGQQLCVDGGRTVNMSLT